jgi:hypothetical protein
VTSTAFQLRTAVRQLSNTVNNQVVTDQEIDARVNEAISELYDLVLGVYENYFLTVFAFTLTGNAVGVGADRVALPGDWYKDIGLDDVRDPLNPITIHAGTTFLERNRGGLHYWFDNQQLVLRPAQRAQGTYQHLYTPLAPALNLPPLLTCDTGTALALPSYAVTGGPGPGHTLTGIAIPGPGSQSLVFANDPTLPVTGQTLFVGGQVNPDDNGVYSLTISDPSFGWVMVRLPAYDQNTEIHTGDQVLVSGGILAGIQFALTSTVINVDVLPLVFTQPSLPQSLQPWYQYVQVHAAIAVKEKREQDTGDLELRLARQTKRVEAMAANRHQEGGQVAITRREASWVGADRPGVDGADW